MKKFINSLDKDSNIYGISRGYSNQISQLKLRENFELLTDKIPNSKTMEEFLNNYLFYNYNAKAKTNMQDQKSFDALDDVRNENIYFLLKGCGLIDQNIDVRIKRRKYLFFVEKLWICYRK